MRLVIQRVKSAKLSVDGELISEIGAGLLVLCGVVKGDTQEQVKRAANKIATIRIFEEDGKMNKSIQDVGGEVLLVSNFTLCTVNTSGARPDFGLSADRQTALELYNAVAKELKEIGIKTGLGVFGADMQIETHLDGPITIYKEIKG